MLKSGGIMRKCLTLIIFLILLLGGTIIFINNDISINIASAKSVSGSITKDETWSGTVYINGDVTITNGANLTINPGTDVIFNSTTYSITVDSGSSLDAFGTNSQKIIFKINNGHWNSVIIQDKATANFTWCEFWGSDNGIRLANNDYGTRIEYCSFNDTGNYFLQLTNSKLDVISTRFESEQFDDPGNLTNNVAKINISDESSQLFIRYFVEIEVINGHSIPLQFINALVQPISGMNNIDQYQGATDGGGKFSEGHVAALRINGTTPNENLDFAYNSSVEIWDKWDGMPEADPGISRQNVYISNATLETKNSILQIPVNFIIDYTPRIDTTFTEKIKVQEDKQETVLFKFHDNDDYKNGVKVQPNKFDNLTIIIKDQLGEDIYDMGTSNSGKENWIKWLPNAADNAGSLYFYRTIESPFTTPGPDDYKAKVLEKIYITIRDDLGNEAETGPINVEFQNIPDKPVINFQTTVEVTEDKTIFIPISISDDDNETNEIEITTDSNYVTYKKSNSSLKLSYPNEFGKEGTQQLVNVTATDNCFYIQDDTKKYNEVTQSINVIFHQTPDPPKISVPIPDLVGTEDDWSSTLDLTGHWSDPDPDDDASTMGWYVTGVNTNYFEVSGENVTADTPLIFNLKSDLELGGARNPKNVEDIVTIWLNDKYGLTDSQDIKLKVSSTNQVPSMHRVYKNLQDLVSVDPEVGDSSTNFKFMVEYKDIDGPVGDEPEFVRVVINNVTYDMDETDPNDKDYKDGKIYHLELKLQHGQYQHYFICSDSDASVRFPQEPDVFSLPKVTGKLYIKKYYSSDLNIVVKIAFFGKDGSAEILFKADTTIEHEQYRGDWGHYFSIKTTNISTIFWIDFTIHLGTDFSNYETKWLRKSDLKLAVSDNNSWSEVLGSVVQNQQFRLICNITPEPSYGYDVLFENIIGGEAGQNGKAGKNGNETKSRPIFAVVGWLDADGDGYYNQEDAFPFDPAARYDRDLDGSPGENEWVPGKDASDSTSEPPLYLDKFPDDPAASIDNDADSYPDQWNPGKSEKDSTSEPRLTLDLFPKNSKASIDTDLDGKPDGDYYNTEQWMDKDDDNDTMLDFWELQWNDYAIENNLSHRFDPKNASDGNLDWDGDGRNNQQEYKDDTNPFKKDSTDEPGLISSEDSMLIIVVVLAIIMILVTIFFYTKMRREQLLEHKVRAKILDHINNNPGIHYRKILNDLELQMGVLTHHLNMLERQKFIISLQDSMYRRFYPADTPIKTKLILSDIQRDILKKIRGQPGISQAEVAREINVAKKVVSYHIKILSDADFVQQEMVGRLSKLYYLDGLDLGKRQKFKRPPFKPPQAG